MNGNITTNSISMIATIYVSTLNISDIQHTTVVIAYFRMVQAYGS